MPVTFILNVEDSRRKARNFSTNLTRGVNVINEVEAENERIRDDIVVVDPPKQPTISVSPPIFNLVVRDFEIGFGGYVTSPEVGLITQINVPVDDSDFYEDQFDFDISDNENPRVDLNSTDPLKVRVGQETFASALLSLDFNYNVETNLDLISVEIDTFNIGWQIQAIEEFDIPSVELSTLTVEVTKSTFVNVNPVIVNLVTDLLSIQLDANAEPITNNFTLQRSVDSGINIQLPAGMVTSPDFNPSP